MRFALALLLVPALAHADDRPLHGSVGIGPSFVITGAGNDRNRFDAEFDLEPWTRLGPFIALRAFDDHHRGLLSAGVIYEAAAARPRLVLDLYGDAGADLDASRPLIGAGIRTTITIIGPLAVGLDTGLHLVIDGVDHSRLQLASDLLLAVRW